MCILLCNVFLIYFEPPAHDEPLKISGIINLTLKMKFRFGLCKNHAKSKKYFFNLISNGYVILPGWSTRGIGKSFHINMYNMYYKFILRYIERSSSRAGGLRKPLGSG
jgi:hypothetical protein